MTPEELHQLRLYLTADLGRLTDATDEDEIDEILSDMREGDVPAENSSDGYAASMCDANGVAFGQYRTMHSIRTMVARELIVPEQWQRKVIEGMFDLRFFKLTETQKL